MDLWHFMTVMCNIILISNPKFKIRKLNKNENKKRNESK